MVHIEQGCNICQKTRYLNSKSSAGEIQLPFVPEENILVPWVPEPTQGNISAVLKAKLCGTYVVRLLLKRLGCNCSETSGQGTGLEKCYSLSHCDIWKTFRPLDCKRESRYEV